MMFGWFLSISLLTETCRSVATIFTGISSVSILLKVLLKPSSSIAWEDLTWEKKMKEPEDGLIVQLGTSLRSRHKKKMTQLFYFSNRAYSNFGFLPQILVQLQSLLFCLF